MKGATAAGEHERDSLRHRGRGGNPGRGRLRPASMHLGQSNFRRPALDLWRSIKVKGCQELILQILLQLLDENAVLPYPLQILRPIVKFQQVERLDGQAVVLAQLPKRLVAERQS